MDSSTSVIGAQPYPTLENLDADSAFCRQRLNAHRHSFTCWKGECVTCRMSYPRQLAPKTYITEIIPDPTNHDELVPIRRFNRSLLGEENISDPPAVNNLSPVDPMDNRTLVCGLRRRTAAEQSQCETNPLTTVLLRCNTSIQPTIAPTQARNAVYYSSKYCSKNPYRLSSTLSALYASQLKLRQFGSIANDAGTDSRTAKCLMQKVLHKAAQIEIADQQAAAANIGIDSFYSSHKFSYVFIWDAVKRLTDNRSDDSKEDGSSAQNDLASVLDVDGDGRFFAITQFDMYIHRSPSFDAISLYDYACCVRTSKDRTDSNQRRSQYMAGRHKLKRYPFQGSDCDIPESIYQTVTTNLRIPILAGPSPPGYPGDKPTGNASEDEVKVWTKNARIFVQYYSLLFLPFGPDMDPRDPTQSHLRVLP